MKTKLISLVSRLALLSFAALYSHQGLSQDKPTTLAYKDLFPTRQVVEVPSANPFLTRMLTTRSSDLTSCIGTINDQAAMKTNGVATAQSGSIVLKFHYEPQSGRSIDVKSSDFRYQDIESCLLRSVKEASLDDDSKSNVIDGKIAFLIACDLKRLSESAWRPGAQVERHCSIKWEVGA